MTRTFEDQPAVRSRVPLLLGLMGPSGGGKTYSALRLATGIQTVSGGDIFVVDTEARRALHYADRFKFRHIPFGAPFSPLDYLAAVEHCVKKGAGVIVVDSMSHEHEGPGGVLEMHQAEVERMAKGDWKKAEKVKMLAWQKPKTQRRRLINTLLQLPVNFIFCFRAKPKLKIVPGKDPQQLGFMPIAGEEFVFEMVSNFLLLPGANGKPTVQSNEVGEKMMIKLPEQFRQLVGGDRPLDEKLGEALAKWAAGTVTKTIPELIAEYEKVADPASIGVLEVERQALWKNASKEEKERLKAVADAAKERVAAAERFQESQLSNPDASDDEPELGATGTDDREPGED